MHLRYTNACKLLTKQLHLRAVNEKTVINGQKSQDSASFQDCMKFKGNIGHLIFYYGHTIL